VGCKGSRTVRPGQGLCNRILSNKSKKHTPIESKRESYWRVRKSTGGEKMGTDVIKEKLQTDGVAVVRQCDR